MNFFYWLNLFGFVLSTVLGSLFIKTLHFDFKSEPSLRAESPPHPFLFGEKISIRDAKVMELARVQGISVAGARRIRAFLDDNPNKGLNDLDSMQGIGPKTIERLREYFF